MNRLHCIILTLVICLASAGVTAAQTTSIWDLDDTSWYDEDESVFILSTEEQLRGLSSLTFNGYSFKGKTIRLANDVAINSEHSWAPIGAYPAEYEFCPFQGTFDGQGHSIVLQSEFMQLQYRMDNGSYCDLGIFGHIGIYGKVMNLHVDIQTPKVALGDDAAQTVSLGGIAGSSFGHIQNCTVSGKLVAAGQGYNFTRVAGILGEGFEESVVADCVNNMDIRGIRVSYVAGIVGRGTGMVIDRCINNGNLELTDARGDGSGKLAGGIAGRFGAYSYGEAGALTNCINSGKIITDATLYSCGGITGSNMGDIMIVNCGNCGDITSDSDAGGISGLANHLDICNCWNISRVMYSNGVEQEALVGSIMFADDKPIESGYFCQELCKSAWGKGMSHSEMNSTKLTQRLNRRAQELTGIVTRYLERDYGAYTPTVRTWVPGPDSGGHPGFTSSR